MAALLEHAANAVAFSDEHPTPDVFSGLADACGEISAALNEVRKALNSQTLPVEVPKRGAR